MNKLFLDISSIILFKPYMTMWRIFYALDRKDLRMDLLLVYLFYDITRYLRINIFVFKSKWKTVIRNCYTANKKSLWGFFFSKKKKKEMIIIMSPKRKVLSSRRLIYLVSLILTFWILLWVTWRSKREITACRNIIT